jgi:hypothetical protein
MITVAELHVADGFYPTAEDDRAAADKKSQ